MTVGPFGAAGRVALAVTEPTRNRIRIIEDVESPADSVELPLPGSPLAITTAQLDAGRSKDIVVRLNNGDVLSIRKVGENEFDAPVVLSSGITGEYLASVQVDGDGPSDLILTDSENPRVVMLHSNGNGNLVQREIALPGLARFVAAVEPRDGGQGLVVVAANADAVWFLAPSGDTFTMAATLATGERPAGAALLFGGNVLLVHGEYGWVESFARIDWTWARRGRYDIGDRATTFSVAARGNETRVLFTSPEHYEIATLSVSSDAAMSPPILWDATVARTGRLIDIDGDGLDDVVLPSLLDGDLVVLRAVADGRYGVRSAFVVGQKPTAGIVTEVGPLGPYAIVIRENADDVVRLSLQTGEVKKLAPTGDAPGAIALLSDPGEASVRFAVSHRSSDEVKVFEWQANASSATEIASLRPGRVYALEAADLDGDGRMDLAAVLELGASGGLAVAFGGENAIWDLRYFETVAGPSAITAIPCGPQTCLAVGSYGNGGIAISRFGGRQQERLVHLPAPAGLLGLASRNGGLAAASFSSGSILYSADPLDGVLLEPIAQFAGARSLAMLDREGEANRNIAILGAEGEILLVTFNGSEWIERAKFLGGGDAFTISAADVNRDGTGDFLVFNQVSGDVSTVLGRCE